VSKKKELSLAQTERRELAESDLEEFIKLVHPKRLLGNVHREVISSFWCRQEAKKYQLLLLPRDHMKSALAAYRVAWEITRDPTIRVLYISSTRNLATKQLKFIKDILTSDNYRLHWPEMVNRDEARREKWTEGEISVDDPRRKEESVRDPTVFTAGLTSNIVGMHCDIIVLDDVVVESNAYIDEGRNKVKNQYSALASIAGTTPKIWIVGTRYHPKDLYADIMGMEIEEYDGNGDVVEKSQLFEIFERQVESSGDGQGEFLWPRQQRSDGKWFGFDAKILAEKKSQYLNKIHFRAQYYNDPHDVDSSPIKRELFQYYDLNYVSRRDHTWYYKRDRLNVVASVDFAFTTGKKSDSSSIVVVGVDGQNNYYVLDIDRFKSDQISEYYKHILKLYDKWGFRKLRAEVSVGQIVIVKDLKENYIRKNGLSLAIEEYRPSRWTGSKEERINATLEPRYSNRQIWHYPSGNCQALEEELIYVNPPHDDIKDALASAIDFAQAPSSMLSRNVIRDHSFEFNTKFGGVA
jgi:hypothetical protein